MSEKGRENWGTLEVSDREWKEFRKRQRRLYKQARREARRANRLERIEARHRARVSRIEKGNPIWLRITLAVLDLAGGGALGRIIK